MYYHKAKWDSQEYAGLPISLYGFWISTLQWLLASFLLTVHKIIRKTTSFLFSIHE